MCVCVVSGPGSLTLSVCLLQSSEVTELTVQPDPEEEIKISPKSDDLSLVDLGNSRHMLVFASARLCFRSFM